MAEAEGIVFKARALAGEELGLIKDVVESCSGLSRQELANTVCELLDWRRPNGGLKTWECKDLLVELQDAGLLQLPPLRGGRPRGSRTKVVRTGRGEPQEPLAGTVRDAAPLSLRQVADAPARQLWRELVERYHYLGHRVPFGAHLRYLVEAARPQPQVVGCLQLSSPAWRMAARDRWIGWSDEVRAQRLQRVVNNSRFLVLPWVKVNNLASAVLALMARQLPSEWQRAYGVRPLLIETLVDPDRFEGTCYRAANWIELGTTSGRGRDDRKHARRGHSPKRLFVYPLARNARQRLRGAE